MRINEMVSTVHENAVNKGFWRAERSFGELIALCHSELSEALEDARNGNGQNEIWYEYEDLETTFTSEFNKLGETLGKPCGIPSELADTVIRIMDMCGAYNIDLEAILLEKIAYNRTRGYKHGGKVF